MKFKIIALFILFLPGIVGACDLCGCFIPRDDARKGFQIGIAEQYSSLSNLYLEGDKVPNLADQYMNSSYTQVLINYRFNERYSLQMNLPLIRRSFQRVESGALQQGVESGIGDMLLVGSYVPFQRRNPYSQLRWKVLAGLKFPTGNSDPIGEELHEDSGAEPSGPLSGVHGHDLALGSGSWDGLIGTELLGRNGKWFYSGHLQYSLRSRGHFDYRYANDLLWYGGPGYYLANKSQYSLGLQGLLTGEHKGEDHLGNEAQDDTAVTSLYAGPTVLLGIRQVVLAEVNLGFPLSIQNSGLQTVPKYRFRVGLTWQFR